MQFYDKAIEELERYPSITIEELCGSLYAVHDDPWRALGFWYPPSFSTEIKWDRWHKDKEGNYDGKKHPYELENSVKYDYDSIMHYPLSSGSGQSTLTIYNAPLVRWVHGGPDYTPPAAVTEENAVLIDEIPHKRGPSDGDFDGVKRLYAWRGGA